ncbi:hypothetical protein [Haladaptatus caseinilyticus]|uniref:hypothetical protein n=1 Tax=Haladaptatus caseinilyticus TaxID=2993314 RepID=UPI00224A7497|nr:hypothetical protein [Haladaptatus caseinilyticus]
MDFLLVGFAAFSFVAQLVILYGWHVQDKPLIVLATWAGYALFWAYLAVTEFFGLEFATIGLAVLLVIFLPLTAVSARRQGRDDRTRSA